MNFYSGIGARITPPAILKRMTEMAKEYALAGYTLRSGAAGGADSAFEAGAGLSKNIYVPWRNFNNHSSPRTPSAAAFDMAAKFHPVWARLNWPAQALLARNCHVILGDDLETPSEFVACWTQDGKVAGGTGHALKIAQAHGISILNLGTKNKF